MQETLFLDGVFCAFDSTLDSAFGGVNGLVLGGVHGTGSRSSSRSGGISFRCIGGRSGSVSFRCFRSRRGGRSRFFAAGGQTNRQQGGNEERAIHDDDYPSKVKRFIPNLAGIVCAVKPVMAFATHTMPARILSVFAWQ